MMLGQLIEHSMANTFLEKLNTKYGGKTLPRPFSKKSKLSRSLDQQSEVLYICIYCIPSSGVSKYFESKIPIIYFYLI